MTICWTGTITDVAVSICRAGHGTGLPDWGRFRWWPSTSAGPVAYWAGHEGYIWHSKTQFRSPAFEGDVTYVDAAVTDKQETSEFGMPVVTVETRMTTQDGATILKGSATVSLPH